MEEKSALTFNQLASVIVSKYKNLERSWSLPQIFLEARALSFLSMLAFIPFFVLLIVAGLWLSDLKLTEVDYSALIRRFIKIENIDPILSFLEEVKQTANVSTLGYVGLIFLFITLLSVWDQIENSVDRIWDDHIPRPYYLRILIVIGLIFFIPIMFSLPLFSMFAFVQSRLPLSHYIPFIGPLLQYVTPIVFMAFIFSMAFKFIPSQKTLIIPAIISGTLTSIFWNITQMGYAYYTANAFNIHVLYGPLGTIPLLMLWIYLNWVIFLFGVQCGAKIQLSYFKV